MVPSFFFGALEPGRVRPGELSPGEFRLGEGRPGDCAMAGAPKPKVKPAARVTAAMAVRERRRGREAAMFLECILRMMGKLSVKT
ncbi:hypothetical protein HMPREF2787_00400 [Corynebacterium sp. HMSC061H03]|nr:hypothetical protein HMPREF2787_00400 [Corynebacterium sp. HMSC061H03]